MEEEKEVKVEKTEEVVQKNKEERPEKKRHNVLRVIGMIIFILVAIYVGNVIRNFYIINTHMIATNEYSTADNYKRTMVQYRGNDPYAIITVYRKGDKSIEKIAVVQDNAKMTQYYDKQKKEAILAFDSRKVAVVEQNTHDRTATVAIIRTFENLSAWQNFLLSLRTIITTEEYKGKECYKINIIGYSEIWVDKETGLEIRKYDGYSKNSEGIRKSIYNDFDYEFGTVTDEDVKRPDLTGYKIQRD